MTLTNVAPRPGAKIDSFEQSLISRGRSATTARIYSDNMRRMQRWRESASACIGREADELARWINQGREAGDSSATTRQKLAAARAYLTWAGEDLGPLGDYKAPPLPPPAPHPLPGGIADVERLIHAARTDENYELKKWLPTLIALGGYAGLRVSEARTVTWDDYNASRRELTVRGKGEKTRVIPVSSKLGICLRQAARSTVDGPIAGAVSDSVARKAITRLAYSIGLDDVNSHDLRATFATEVFNRTHNIVLTSKLLGHSSIATTQAYLGYDTTAAAAAVEW